MSTFFYEHRPSGAGESTHDSHGAHRAPQRVQSVDVGHVSAGRSVSGGTHHGGGPKRHPQWPVSMAGLQAKLKINRIGDVHEQEADRVADAVVRGGAVNEALTPVGGGVAQRKCAACDQEEEDVVQRKESVGSTPLSSAASSSVMPAVAGLGGGRALGDGVRARMERGIGADFSGVRVHDGSEAAERASALNARAYTAGRDIVFGAGEYRPGTSSGDRLLAHELVHVEQQRKGVVDGVQREAFVDANIIEIPDPKTDKALRQNPQVCLLQVHPSERQSLDAGYRFAAKYHANLVVLDNWHGADGKSRDDPTLPGGSRELRVRYGSGGKCKVDPNRIFPTNPEAIRSSTDVASDALAQCSKACENPDTKKDILAAIVAYRIKVKEAIDSARGGSEVPIISLHNNVASTTNVNDFAEKYGPRKRSGGVLFNKGSFSDDPHDFLLVTRESDFERLRKNDAESVEPSEVAGQLNVMLQDTLLEADKKERVKPLEEELGGNLDIDGSASVMYRHDRYINLEIHQLTGDGLFEDMIRECEETGGDAKPGVEPHVQPRNMRALEILARYLKVTRRDRVDCGTLARAAGELKPGK